MQLNPYLTFDGRCEAAFKFYEKVLGGRNFVARGWRGYVLQPPGLNESFAKVVGRGPVVTDREQVDIGPGVNDDGLRDDDQVASSDNSLPMASHNSHLVPEA